MGDPKGSSVRISDIESNFASEDLMSFIHKLYSNVQPIDNLIIHIKGDDELVKGFLNYTKNMDFIHLGFRHIQFHVNDELISHTITSDNYEQELDDILIHYI